MNVHFNPQPIRSWATMQRKERSIWQVFADYLRGSGVLHG